MRPCGRLSDDACMSNRRGPEPAWDDELVRLIQLGRDREAAELAIHHLGPVTQGALMEPRDQLEEILPLVSKLVEPLTDDQLNAGTPCAAFTVRDILEHMIGGATMFAAAFRGMTPTEPAGGSEPLAAFPVALGNLRDSVGSPGALDRTIAAPFGEVPGDTFARFVALDGLLHGWDIATATGQPYDPSAAVVAAVDTFARQTISDDMRANGMFASPVDPPLGASPIVRLAAFTGRQV